MENFLENIDIKNLFCYTYFRSDFRQIFGDFEAWLFKIVEAVVNLFLKLQTSNLTNIDKLGVKLELI